MPDPHDQPPQQPDREQVREAIMQALRNRPLGPWAMEARSQAAADNVLALLASSRPPAQADRQAISEASVLPPVEVARIRSVSGGNAVTQRLADSHEALRDMAGRHDPTGADHMAEMWEHAQRADAAETERDALRAEIERLRASSLSVPQQGEVLWEGETIATLALEPTKSSWMPEVYELFLVPPGTRVRVVTVPEPIVLDVTAETGDENSPVICQAYGQVSPMYVCLREAEGEWRSPAEARSLALCSEHGAYALDEGWVRLPAVPKGRSDGE